MVKTRLPNKKFWKKKKIFLTGHTSFKGSWLKLWLEYLGSEVLGYSIDYPSFPNSLYKVFYKEKLKKQSILDFKNLENSIKKFNPSIIFHLAAQSIVSEAAKNPLENYKTNIIGTAAVLEAASKSKKTKLVIIITTDKCYEENKEIKYYSENSKLGGSEPYSASKSSAEIIAKSYSIKYKNLKKKIITLRAGNVVGGGDWKKNRLIPDLIKSIVVNKELKLRNPNYIRPWLHVLDCLNGYLIAGEFSYRSKKVFDTWNFAPKLSNQITVFNLAKNLYYRFNQEKKIKYDKKKHFYEAGRLNLNPTKAKNELNWKSILNKKLMINFIYDWYINYSKKKNMKIYSISQIKKFYDIALGKNK